MRTACFFIVLLIFSVTNCGSDNKSTDAKPHPNVAVTTPSERRIESSAPVEPKTIEVNEFTRDQAQNILNSDLRMGNPVSSVTGEVLPGWTNACHKALSGFVTYQKGQWVLVGGRWQKGQDVVNVTDQGRRYISSARSKGDSLYEVTFLEAYKRQCIVTGIANQGTDKLVEFNWDYRDFPFEIGICIPGGRSGTGSALMRLYDDGWRVGELNFK